MNQCDMFTIEPEGIVFELDGKRMPINSPESYKKAVERYAIIFMRHLADLDLLYHLRSGEANKFVDCTDEIFIYEIEHKVSAKIVYRSFRDDNRCGYFNEHGVYFYYRMDDAKDFLINIESEVQHVLLKNSFCFKPWLGEPLIFLKIIQKSYEHGYKQFTSRIHAHYRVGIEVDCL